MLISDAIAAALERELSPRDRSRVAAAIDRLQHDPYSGSITVGTSQPAKVMRVLPVGDLRLIYSIDEGTSSVIVSGLYNKRDAEGD